MTESTDKSTALERFNAASIRHPLYDAAMEQLQAFDQAEHSLGFMTGPPLVGKSNVVRAYANKVNAGAGNAMPVLCATATKACDKEFHVDLLLKAFAAAAKAPGLEPIVEPPRRPASLFGDMYVLPSLPKGSARRRQALMCDALGYAARYRRVRLLVVDEVGEILTGSPDQNSHRIHCLRGIAETADVRLLLVGRDAVVADALEKLERIPRVPLICLPRYLNPRKKREYAGFWRFIHTLVETVPEVEFQKIHAEDMTRMHLKCLGCPGWLATMVRDALYKILTPGLSSELKLRVEQIVREGHDSKYLLDCLREIENGERRISPFLSVGREAERANSMLMARLDLVESKPSGRPNQHARTTNRNGPSGSKNRRQKVGERRPRRLEGE